jgi:putative Holliday junction resolvase
MKTDVKNPPGIPYLLIVAGKNPLRRAGVPHKLTVRNSMGQPGTPSRFPNPRFLGLDIGNRRIGVAVSDELGLTAQPVLTLERRSSRREDLRSLARLCRRFGVAGIVVGNPLHLSGEPSPQAAKIQAFAAELGTLTGLPVHLWDERLTSHEAHQILYEAGHARQEHGKVVDQVAATLILQSFLESREQGDQGTREQGSQE